METASGNLRRFPLPSAATSLAFVGTPETGSVTLAVGMENGRILLLDVADGQSRELSHGGNPDVWSLASFGTELAAGNAQGEIIWWDLVSSKPIRIITGHASAVFALDISPDGTMLASGGMDGVLRVWDFRTGKQLLTLGGHNGWINSLAFSPDGRFLLSVGSDGTARMWGVLK
jgi:WD40 repeat protein